MRPGFGPVSYTHLWADFRRTGFPHLIPAMESAVGNNSQGIRNLTLGARRMSYPADEATNNPENYAKAVEDVYKRQP